MKYLILICLLGLPFFYVNGQSNPVDLTKVEEDLEALLYDLSNNYVYVKEKKIDLECIKEHYRKQIKRLKTKTEVTLFFEYLLDEFYDSHLILNTNTRSSFRLYAPIYVQIQKDKIIIKNLWKSQIEPLSTDLIGAEIQAINGLDFKKAIEAFPTHCQDKNDPIIRTWISNKIIAGRYNEPRVLTLKLANQKIVQFDMNQLQQKKNLNLLSFGRQGDVGWIRINNTLGQDGLVSAFDRALSTLSDPKSLILDLRNTVDGGDSYEARGIMGRLIDQPMPYQIHSYIARSEGNPSVERMWMEYVVPRGKQYKGKIVVLVGRWTGSMGEGLAIGLDGMKRARVLGTEMERLAGEMTFYQFKNRSYGYRLSTAKISHIDGTLREQYVPKHYVEQNNSKEDETFEKALEWLRE